MLIFPLPKLSVEFVERIFYTFGSYHDAYTSTLLSSEVISFGSVAFTFSVHSPPNIERHFIFLLLSPAAVPTSYFVRRRCVGGARFYVFFVVPFLRLYSVVLLSVAGGGCSFLVYIDFVCLI